MKTATYLPASQSAFVDEMCARFNVRRSTYIQMLLEAERENPRNVFTRFANEKP